MYLQFITGVSYFFAALFILLVLRTFGIPYLLKLRQKKQAEAYDEKEQELIKKGNRPFFYEHGRVKVFALTPEQADAQYREMKQKLKKAKKDAVLSERKK